MATRRTARVAAALRQVVSNAILFELRDPRVVGVTVLNVEVPEDLRSAKVYISILGEEKVAKLTLMGLEASRGWIQSRIADELQLRQTPILSFVVDPGIKKSIEVSRILRELQPPTPVDEESELDEVEDEESAVPSAEDGTDEKTDEKTE